MPSWDKDIDDEMLIASIQCWPAIYDRGDKNHHNRTYINRAWENVGKEVGANGNACRRRWQTIRDYFVKIHRASKTTAQDGTPARKIKWCLYDQMSFLIPLCAENAANKVIKMDENDSLSTETDINQIQFEMEDEGQSLSHSISSEEFNDTRTSFPTQMQQRKRKLPSFAQPSNLHYEIVNPPKETQTTLDHNEHFFKSLLPSLKQLDNIEVMEFRIEVQSLLLKYLKAAKQRKSKSASMSYTGACLYEVNGRLDEEIPVGAGQSHSLIDT